MRHIIALTALYFAATPSFGAAGEKSYWFLMKNNGAWCGYDNKNTFERAMTSTLAAETGWAKLRHGHPSEMIHIVRPESGDWIIEDKYAFARGRISLTRSISLAERQLRRIEKGSAPLGRKPKLKTVSIKYFKGKTAARDNLDYPEERILSSPKGFPFSTIFGQLTASGLSTACTGRR